MTVPWQPVCEFGAFSAFSYQPISTVPPMMVNARTARWPLAGWTAARFAGMAWHGGLAWHLFVQGAQALTDADDPAGGLHLYVVAPALQIEPLAFLVTECLRVLGGRSDLLAAQVLGTAGGGRGLCQAGRLGRRVNCRTARTDAVTTARLTPSRPTAIDVPRASLAAWAGARQTYSLAEQG